MFEASRPFLFFDYFRIPYAVEVDRGGAAGPGSSQLHATGTGRMLRWPDERTLAAIEPRGHRVAGGQIFARLLDDTAVRQLLPGPPASWQRAPLSGNQDGCDVSIWRSSSGDLFLPFSPDEAIMACWTESYESVSRGSGARSAKRFALGAYYRLRPFLPRAVQIALRRGLRRVQERRSFPRWPYETSLHDLYDVLFDLVAELAEEAVPWLAPWPGDHRWAFVLTHDVETEAGYRNVGLMRAAEKARNLRSSWNFVPLRYDVEDDLVADLDADGFEVGVHGLYHDGRDLASEAVLRERLPRMLQHARRWNAVGFRSPATHRDWSLMRLLAFDYDSSYPDSDPFEPKGGGCCTWLPFFNGDLVELPITLVQDHTLFVILRRTDESLWREKTDFLRARGGMALLITHPDYMLDPMRLTAYERFMDAYAEDTTAWHALPREISSWWRRRSASHIVRDGDGSWRIEGPSSGEGRLALHEPGAT